MSEYAFVTDPVVRAVREEDVAKIRELAAGGVSLDEPDGTFGPPLVAALRDENREMLALLLELGADPNGPDLINWETPLCEAALNRDIKAVELLLVTLYAFLLAYVPFACVFSFATLGWIYGTQIASGEFHVGTSLSGIPTPFLFVLALPGIIQLLLFPHHRIYVQIVPPGLNLAHAFLCLLAQFLLNSGKSSFKTTLACGGPIC